MFYMGYPWRDYKKFRLSTIWIIKSQGRDIKESTVIKKPTGEGTKYTGKHMGKSGRRHAMTHK